MPPPALLTAGLAATVPGPRSTAEGAATHSGSVDAARIPPGPLLARILTGSWRAEPATVRLSPEEAERALPHLLRLGCAGLALRRLPDDDGGDPSVLRELRRAHGISSLHARAHRRRLRSVLSRFRDAGLEPILGKGWAAARLYPDPSLRPYGDIDLWVGPGEAERARKVLGSDGDGYPVDLHAGPAIPARTWRSIVERSRVIDDGELGVRTFGAEDHLALLAAHMLGEGVRRPLWLCDVAAAVEARPDDFDWGYLLEGSELRADWIRCALLLAAEILGADLRGTPFATQTRPLPSWTVPAAQRAWERSGHPTQGPSVATELRSGLSHAGRALLRRWPNPIAVTVRLRGRFDRTPRILYQLADAGLRTARFLLGLVSR